MFIDTAVSKGIQVIACQKVIHPMLLLNLRRQGILVLQRLGRQKAEALENLSGKVKDMSFTYILFLTYCLND